MNIMNKIDGKIAIVTGGTQGLGTAIARHFAYSGAKGLVICGRNLKNGGQVAKSITNETQVEVSFVKTDLAQMDQVQTIVPTAKKLFGTVDILVNAAGLTDRGNLLNTSVDLYDRIFAVNTRAPFFLMQDVVKLMIEKNVQGTIVNIGSASAHAGQPFIAPYCASKGALATLTRNSGYALMRNKIRVNQLNIGWMASEGEDRIQREFHGADKNWLEKAAKEQPFGRLIDPKEVARAVTFLASDDSGMMTGSVIHYDQSVWGGYSFGPPSPNEPLAE